MKKKYLKMILCFSVMAAGFGVLIWSVRRFILGSSLFCSLIDITVVSVLLYLVVRRVADIEQD